nr:transposase [Microcystis aeruginosa LE13-04]
MLVVEAKLKNGTPEQYQRLDEAIRTSQFVRNSCVRYWMDNKGTTRNDLQKLCAVLANNKELIDFIRIVDAQIPGKKGFPRFKKHSRSVEYKLTGYQLSDERRKIKFTDGFKAGEFDLWCSQKTLVYYSEQQIKRVRVVRRADGYY